MDNWLRSFAATTRYIMLEGFNEICNIFVFLYVSLWNTGSRTMILALRSVIWLYFAELCIRKDIYTRF